MPPAPTLAAPPVAAPSAPAPTQPRFDADYLDNPKPPCPSISRRMGEKGRVLPERGDAQGLPVNVQLLASSGSERLDTSALQTVRRCIFVPARLGNEAVAATVLGLVRAHPTTSPVAIPWPQPMALDNHWALLGES